HESSPYSALIHRVQGTVCVKIASIIDDPNAKQRHLRNAIESARRAVSLSPYSIEFAHFYANLLYEAANDGKEYEEVVQECERAMAIENPIDPAKESLQEESQQKISPAEARISHIRGELQNLIQKSNFASISSWMKNIGTGEEKFRLIPIRRVSEDPMELRLVQARRPNEIKKATKTPEERRKEIEVRVAAARLLQQKSGTVKSQNEEYTGLDSTAGSGQRAGERRKSGNARKTASSTERRNLVQSYWNSMSLDVKKELFSIRISDLKAHFSSSKDRLAIEVLSESLAFAKTNKTWKFWTCCRCSEKFANSESHIHHVVHDHMGALLPKMQSVLPQSVENEWAEMLLNCSWKPLDVNAAVEILDKQSRSQGHGFLDESYERDDGEGSKDDFLEAFCHEDEWDTSARKKKLGDRPNRDMVESRKNDKISDIDFMDCDGDGGPKIHLLPEGLPLSDDPERVKLLERIHAVFETLIKNKYLASSHLSKVMHFAVEELQGLAFGSKLLNYNIDQSPLCICFLGPEELKKILKYLQELSHSCGLGRYPEGLGRYPERTGFDETSNGCHGFDDLEKIVFSEDDTCLLFDKQFLQHNLSPSSCPNAVSNDRPAAILSGNQYQNGVLIDSDALLSWLFTGPSSVEALASWTRAREEKAQQGMEILRLLEKEYYDLQGLCERKSEHLSYEEALQAVEDLCLEEGKKREHEVEFVRQSYDSVLRKRREELIESDSEVTIISRFELDAISNVLKEAESLNVNQFGFEETYGGGTSQFCDLESGEEDDWRLKDYLHQVDSSVEVAIQRQKEHVSIELSKIDARIMRMVTGMQQLEVKLEPASAQDYRQILVPLLKSFMRAHLEDLAEKDATEKSDAARDAFLAELARDSEKSSSGGNEKSKHAHEKTKDKKKNKEYRRAKDSKPNSGNESHVLHHEIVEDASFAAPDGDDQESEIPQTGNSLNLQEEEYRRMIELEAEERKLEETLEYQRRIENEAKLKHLAEQHKKSARTIQENMGAAINLETCPYQKMYPDTYLNCCDIDQKINEQLKSSEKNNVLPNSLEGPSKNFPEVMAQRDESPEDGVLISDKRSARKGRRQKGSTKFSEGKFQSGSSERENTAVSESRALDSSHEKNGTRDSGTKTLRQLHVEEDDEERFQADLKRAVRQSLDAFHAHQKLPLKASSGAQRMFSETGDMGNEISVGNVNEMDVYGTGLKNEVGEYNCFLNVIIQSLWHLRQFRDEFLRRTSSEHDHVGDPCVVCALYDIFTALSMASTEMRREAVAPTTLRIALSNLYPDSNFFQEAQMNDASEVLGVIFDCLHRSFISTSGLSDTESADSSCMGSWDCSSSACIVHSLFGMDIFERMNCYNCGLESRHLKYTSFF
uniref:USP domain-containing protein n=1 Tax=Nicotiana tabacum TaxID=4097 RepID=A0A1S3XFJ3_TOBAC